MNLKYGLTMAGWKLNRWFVGSGFHRLPIVGPTWFAGKRMVAGWLASGQGVQIDIGGQKTNVHPFTIVYSLDDWEPYTEELFQNAIKPGSTVLDLGAHHGYFSLLAARHVGKKGKVYAFEPAPENFQVMKKNIELSHLTNVVVVNKAVSDKRDTVQFFLCKPNEVQGSLYSTFRPGESTITVESIALDEYLEGKPVDVFKMDIEGGEPSALRGMVETLSRSKDIVLFVEFNHHLLDRAGVSPEDFLAQLDAAGFDCQIINEGLKELQPFQIPFTPEQFLGEGFCHGFCNIYCTRKATAA